MLVTRILGDCPGCARSDTFGNVDVFGSVLVRGCGYCEYREEIPLPPIHKKIIYLDQSFYSHAFRGGDERFVEAANRIEAAASKQLLAAPRSSIHENETQLWSRREELHEFIKTASLGARFEPSYRVEHKQIQRAFRAWLKGEPSTYVTKERDAVDGDVHKWERYFWIDVGRMYTDPSLLREGKERAVDGLIAILDSWRASSLTFDEHLAIEYRDAAISFVDAYKSYMKRMFEGDFMATLDSPIASKLVESLMHMLPESEPFEDRLRRCCVFLGSEHFKNTPTQLLSARLFAALRDAVKDGAYTNPEKAKEKLKGVFYDIDHIATYAPYCDAIIVDQPMASLVAHPGVALESRYRVKVFTVQKFNQLFAWLDELEAGIDEWHSAALAAINAPGRSGLSGIVPSRPSPATP